jgi:hypothetical protein
MSATAPPSLRKQPYQPGTAVKVNGYKGKIRKVIERFEHYDPFHNKTCELRLAHPLYEVELDFSKKYYWEGNRIHIPPNKTRMRLFADEFCLFRKPSSQLLAYDPAG